MDEYISRKAVLKCIAEDGYNCEYDLGYWSHNTEFQELIKEIPAADVRPVVLCRDCIYAPTGNQDGADLEWPCDDFPERNPCPLKCEDRWYSRKPAPDFFCADGVKLNT